MRLYGECGFKKGDHEPFKNWPPAFNNYSTPSSSSSSPSSPLSTQAQRYTTTCTQRLCPINHQRHNDDKNVCIATTWCCHTENENPKACKRKLVAVIDDGDKNAATAISDRVPVAATEATGAIVAHSPAPSSPPAHPTPSNGWTCIYWLFFKPISLIDRQCIHLDSTCVINLANCLHSSSYIKSSNVDQCCYPQINCHDMCIADISSSPFSSILFLAYAIDTLISCIIGGHAAANQPHHNHHCSSRSRVGALMHNSIVYCHENSKVVHTTFTKRSISNSQRCFHFNCDSLLLSCNQTKLLVKCTELFIGIESRVKRFAIQLLRNGYHRQISTIWLRMCKQFNTSPPSPSPRSCTRNVNNSVCLPFKYSRNVSTTALQQRRYIQPEAVASLPDNDAAADVVGRSIQPPSPSPPPPPPSCTDDAISRTAHPDDTTMERHNVRKSTHIHHCISSRQHTRPNPQHLLLLLIAIIVTYCIPMVAATTHNIKYSTNIVKTKYGPLRGIVVRSNPTVEAFLGVPYASPPVGSLRYMPPVTPSTWRNTRPADRYSPVCPQAPPILPDGPEALLEMPRGRLAQLRRLLPLLANQSEDCLYLNLYAPRDVDSEATKQNSLATIVYVHGESYEWNSGNPYDGSVLAAHGNIIVVTINFRLGILGFLKTGTKGSAQGNFGLMDLVAGLHWLRENLPAFGGDPNRVTLMGHGTGAALANMLIVSPVAHDLVTRAILLSGSALSPWAIQKDPLYVKKRVAEGTNCHGDLQEDDLAPCLRTRSVAELLAVTLDVPRFLPGFAPFVDGTVITTPSNSATGPLTLPAGSAVASTTGIELADFPSRELLFGLTSIESYLDLSAQDLEFGFNETRRDRILRTYVRNVYHYHLNEIYSALKNEYTDWERPPRIPLGSRDASLELLSDGHTAAPLVRLGYLHSLRGGRSYFLHFRHQSGERDFPQRSGTVRGEDVPFCLGLPISPLFPYNYTKQDIKISRILVRYLANFAQTGNPNDIPSSASSPTDISHSLTNHHNEPENSHPSISNESQSSKKKRNTNGRGIRANRRSNTNDSNDSDEEDGEDDDESDNVEAESSKELHSSEQETDKKDRLDGINIAHVPFWDTYDAINQLYIELGNKVEIRNHYRGHKLSMWLSLIPQLHSPGEVAELNMRHHHFLEESAQFYDGIVRPQTMQRPTYPKAIPTAPTTIMPKIEIPPIVVTASTSTECPPNSTIIPTIAATRPQQNQAAAIDLNTSNNLLRRLATSQYQSYTTALTVTIAVGCFLLLLNVLIFAGIYYQREKRANDAKKKEELTEAENRCTPPMGEKCGKASRKSSLQSVSGFNPGGSFGEYSCYDEKMQCKEKHALADICSVELPLQEFKCSPASGSNTNSLRRGAHNSSDSCKHNLLNASHSNLLIYPPSYLSAHVPSMSDQGASSSNGLVTYHQFHMAAEQCNQSTQSELPLVQDVGTVMSEKDVDNDDSPESPEIPEPPPPPRSTVPYQGSGILRQQGGPATPAAAKKRVQIQEINV